MQKRNHSQPNVHCTVLYLMAYLCIHLQKQYSCKSCINPLGRYWQWAGNQQTHWSYMLCDVSSSHEIEFHLNVLKSIYSVQFNLECKYHQGFSRQKIIVCNSDMHVLLHRPFSVISNKHDHRIGKRTTQPVRIHSNPGPGRGLIEKMRFLLHLAT